MRFHCWVLGTFGELRGTSSAKSFTEGKAAGATGLIRVDRSLRGVRSGRGGAIGHEALQYRQAREERRAEHSGRRQGIRISATGAICTGDRIAVRAIRFRICSGARSEKVGQASGRAAGKNDGEKRRLKGELVYCAHIFADVVDTVASADGSAVLAKQIVGQAKAWAQAGGILTVKRRCLRVTGEIGDAQIIYAAGIDEWILPLQGQAGLHVANVAGAIDPCAHQFGAQPQVQGQILGGLPVILEKHREVVLFVFVVVDAATTKAELRRTDQQEVLKVGGVEERKGEGLSRPAYW